MSWVLRTLLILSISILSVIGSARAQDEEREGGIVGTGIKPAGLLGVITGLGSILINGQRVVFDDTLQVQSPLGARTAKSLVPGETVVVEANPFGEGLNTWRALRIQHYVP